MQGKSCVGPTGMPTSNISGLLESMIPLADVKAAFDRYAEQPVAALGIAYAVFMWEHCAGFVPTAATRCLAHWYKGSLDIWAGVLDEHCIVVAAVYHNRAQIIMEVSVPDLCSVCFHHNCGPC